MKYKLYVLYWKLQDLASREDGQDLVEYALLVAFVAFAATTGMVSLANGMNTVFLQISSTLGSYVSQ